MSSTLTSTTVPATPAQLQFILKLTAERPGWVDALNGYDFERCFDVTTHSGKFVGKMEASNVIDALLKVQPAKQVTTSTTVTGAGLDLSGLPSGIYAVPGGDTRLKVKIDVVTSGKWAGWVFVKDGAEYGYGKKYGSQKPGQKYQGAIVAELAAIAADPAAASAAYGHLTDTCGLCGRPLENEESVARGIGPVCAGKLGWS